MPAQPTVQIINTSTKKLLIPACRIAMKPLDQQQGFMGQPALREDEGILFIWSEPGIYPMHMRNVKFPLLMAWIDESKMVIDMRVAFPESPLRYQPLEPVRFCLECHPIQSISLELGDRIAIVNNVPG